AFLVPKHLTNIVISSSEEIERKDESLGRCKRKYRIRNQQLKLNLLKANDQVLAYQGRADEGELIIRGKNRKVDHEVDDIIDGTNNNESTDVSANQASLSIMSIAMGKVDRTILLSTCRDIIKTFRMWTVPNNMEFILDPNDRRMARIFTPSGLEELRNMVNYHINSTINKDLWDFVESFQYKNYCASNEIILDPDIDEQYYHKIYVINVIQALNVVPSIPSRDRRNRGNSMEVRVQSGNKPGFHLMESPQLMCGEIKRGDDLKTDQLNTGKLLQELSDELEYVFKNRVGIYVMRVLGNGVYLGSEVDNFEIPTILQDIDKLIDGIQKVLISKVRFEESVKCIEITKKVVYPSSPRLVSDLPGKIVRATNHSPKR
ncbi:606_t:CDS:2, partial [Acaulospora morrowiae]